MTSGAGYSNPGESPQEIPRNPSHLGVSGNGTKVIFLTELTKCFNKVIEIVWRKNEYTKAWYPNKTQYYSDSFYSC